MSHVIGTTQLDHARMVRILDLLPPTNLERIAQVFNDSLVYHGEGVHFSKYGTDDVASICSFLFSRSPLSREMGTWENVRNVCYKTDPEYLHAFRQELSHALLTAFEQRERVSEELFNLFVHQTLALFPFAYPEEGYEVQIPVKEEEGWRLANYRLDRKFNLTNGWFSSPLPAYGFVGEGPPQLVFMGTTYPAGEGFLASLFSDLFPRMAVGQLPMRLGKEVLAEWLEGKENIHASGISLGGALSLRAAKEFGDKISEVYANLPPGLNSRELDSFSSGTQINLLFQEGDIVSKIGFFPEGENVKLYHIFGEEKENAIIAHARVFATAPTVTVLQGNPAYENQRFSRKILTALNTIFSPLLFLFLLPVYLVNRICKFLANPAR